MSTVTLNFTGNALATLGYNVYRARSCSALGTMINLAVIPQVAAPYNVVYVDNAINSVTPPVETESPYWYRVTAINALGLESLPSDGIRVDVRTSAMVNDHLQQNIYELLTADTDLITLLGGGAQALGRILWFYPTPEVPPTPFVTFRRSGWNEDRTWKDGRHGTILYDFRVWNGTHDSDVLRSVSNRMHRILDAAQRALSCKSANVAAAMYVEGPGESYDNDLSLWYVQDRLELTVELVNV